MIESALDVGGAVVFWTASEFTDRDKLKAGLVLLGLDPFVPDPRPPASVLKDALEETLGGSRVLVRPLADRDGFTVVKEERGKNANYYATALIARVRNPDLPTIEYEPDDDRAIQVNRAFRRHSGRIPGVQLSACLVKIVEFLGGTRLRPTGAVYWIPGPKLDEWALAAQAVEAASGGGVVGPSRWGCEFAWVPVRPVPTSPRPSEHRPRGFGGGGPGGSRGSRIRRDRLGVNRRRCFDRPPAPLARRTRATGAAVRSASGRSTRCVRLVSIERGCGCWANRHHPASWHALRELRLPHAELGRSSGKYLHVSTGSPSNRLSSRIIEYNS